ERIEKGRRIRREVLGAEHVDRELLGAVWVRGAFAQGAQHALHGFFTRERAADPLQHIFLQPLRFGEAALAHRAVSFASEFDPNVRREPVEISRKV
ncbi:MAG TPA: hypothetical protein VIW78_00540, partial [Burkholderiales bacterium]